MPARIHGPFAIHEWYLENVGDINRGHKHDYWHMGLVVRGSIRLRTWVQEVHEDGTPKLNCDGNPVWNVRPGSQVFRAGDTFDVPAELGHEFKALEPHTRGLCIFPHRDPITHEIVETANGWTAAYG